MRRFFFPLLLLLGTAVPALAQTPAPDYSIRVVRPARYDPATGEITVSFDVVNAGGAAAVPATALVYLADGTEVARGFINPLQPDARVTVNLTFRAADFPDEFPPGSTQSLRIAVGLDEVEPSGAETAGDNLARVSVFIPAEAAETNPEPTPSDDGALDVLGIAIDTRNPVTTALLIAGAGAAVVLLLIALLIIRLLTPRRPRDFGAWTPPYAGLPVYDPLTTAGRRQGWQPFAQNDQPPLPTAGEGATHIRKLLVGKTGAGLENWRVAGLRLSQYDQYGRIARSEVIAPRRLARRLDRAARQRSKLDAAGLLRRVRPVAGALVGRFRRQINQRTAMLPVALDIRFQGLHGEVRIVFELFHNQRGQWRIVDQWEPEMTVTDKVIRESYTYTFHGARPSETLKDFYPRLQDDIARALAEMIARAPAVLLSQDTPTRPPDAPPRGAL
jgi:hypothetical protein